MSYKSKFAIKRNILLFFAITRVCSIFLLLYSIFYYKQWPNSYSNRLLCFIFIHITSQKRRLALWLNHPRSLYFAQISCQRLLRYSKLASFSIFLYQTWKDFRRLINSIQVHLIVLNILTGTGNLKWRANDVISIVLDTNVVIARYQRCVSNFVTLFHFCTVHRDFAGAIYRYAQHTASGVARINDKVCFLAGFNFL